jgi:AmmeMemoRadiSam system protein A
VNRAADTREPLGAAVVSLARRAIEADLLGGPPPRAGDDERLAAPGAAFVTVKVGGELRGCIGRTDRTDALAAVVARCARAAAFEDPRFDPIAPSDLPGLQVQVSVLSDPVPLADVAALDVGRHGLIVARGRRRGLLLPQVAVEHGWTPVEFLAHTCRKAGLPDDAWREGADLFVFEAEVFT